MTDLNINTNIVTVLEINTNMVTVLEICIYESASSYVFNNYENQGSNQLLEIKY